MPVMSSSGTQKLTAAGTIGVASTPVRIFSIHIIGDGTAPVITLLNGGSGGTIYVKETGNATTNGKTINYGTKGQLFPSDCYCTFDVHTVSVTAAFSH